MSRFPRQLTLPLLSIRKLVFILVIALCILNYPSRVSAAVSPPAAFAPAQSYSVPGDATHLVIGDFNNDGKADLVVRAERTVAVLIGDGSGGFGAPITTTFPSLDGGPGTGIDLSGTAGRGLAAADFNGDGKLDLALGNLNRVAIAHGDGTGHFGLAYSYGIGNDFRLVNDLAIADFNRDGKPDVAALTWFTPGSLIVAFGDGFGVNGGRYYGGSLNETSPRGMVVADFNGDHNLDIVARLDGGAWLSLGDGSGNFTETFTGIFPVGSVDGTFASGDFNCDGNADFAAGEARAYLGDGSGQFAPGVPYAVPGVPFGVFNGSQALGAADMNGDGKLDLVVAGGSTASILLGNGDGSFASLTNFGVVDHLWDMAVGDLNGDGKPDIATVSSDEINGTVSVLLNNSNGLTINSLFDTTKAHKSGSTIPVKLQVLDSDGTNRSSSSLAVTAFDLRFIGGTTSAPVVDSGNANPDYNFRYEPSLGGTGGSYIFNLSTKGLAPGTYALMFYVGCDRTFLRSVNFEVK